MRVTAATGHAPGQTPAAQLGVPGSHNLLVPILFTAPVAFGLFIVAFARLSPGFITSGLGLLLTLLCGIMVLVVCVILVRERRARSPAGSARKHSAWLLVPGILALVVVFLPAVLLLYRAAPPSGATSSGLVPVGQSLSNPATADQLVPPRASIPTHIEFKVLRVEIPPGTRNIVMHFERDTNSDLGFEVWQNVMPSQAGQVPAIGFRDWKQRYWVDVNGPRTLTWVLPKEFTEAEAGALAKEMERKWKGSHVIDEGARPEFGTAIHREGWQYILCANVLREPGSADGVEPPKPATFEVRLVVDTHRPTRSS